MRDVGEALRQLLKNYNLETAVEGSIFSTWKEISGEEVSGHSKVKDIRNNVLYVEVDHPGWMQMMHLKKRKILSAVGKKYPELGIKDVRFYLFAGS